MAPATLNQVPEGCVAVPLDPGQATAPVRICMIGHKAADPAGGPWVILRRAADAAVFLGALVDRGGVVHRWLEIWVQQVASVPSAPSAQRQTLTNAILDERWITHGHAIVELEPDLLIRTGAESEHPLPVYQDPSSGAPVHPLHEGNPWRLCTDDALLLRRGLPAYSSSLHRYWHVVEMGEQAPFVPLTPGAPVGEGCLSPDHALGALASAPALNLEGGLMIVRTLAPFDLAGFSEVLGGKPWDGWSLGKTPLALGAASESLKETAPAEQAVRRLFFLRQGPEARLLEIFYLKLKLWADAVSAVRAHVARTRRPLLNLAADSFAVHLCDAATALPVLWTARVRLADGGMAAALPIPHTGRPCWFLMGEQAPSVYRPAGGSQDVRGRAGVRIRKVIADPRGTVTVDGTFSARELKEIGRNDLVWLRLPAGGGPVDLYASLDQESSLAAGEWRFRASEQARAADSLKALEGVACRDVPFEVLSQWSTPCDLYALGAVAVGIFLGNKRQALPVALDHVFSLARQVAADSGRTAGLTERIHGVYESDPRWPEAVGFLNIMYEPASPGETGGSFPLDLWLDTLALIIRAFPGVGPDSWCRDFSDAPEGGPHQVFDGMAAGLERLLSRTRGLLCNDTRCNREIRDRIVNFRR